MTSSHNLRTVNRLVVGEAPTPISSKSRSWTGGQRTIEDHESLVLETLPLKSKKEQDTDGKANDRQEQPEHSGKKKWGNLGPEAISRGVNHNQAEVGFIKTSTRGGGAWGLEKRGKDTLEKLLTLLLQAGSI